MRRVLLVHVRLVVEGANDRDALYGINGAREDDWGGGGGKFVCVRRFNHQCGGKGFVIGKDSRGVVDDSLLLLSVIVAAVTAAAVRSPQPLRRTHCAFCGEVRLAVENDSYAADDAGGGDALRDKGNRLRRG